jgi:hypothetical protein
VNPDQDLPGAGHGRLDFLGHQDLWPPAARITTAFIASTPETRSIADHGHLVQVGVVGGLAEHEIRQVGA